MTSCPASAWRGVEAGQPAGDRDQPGLRLAAEVRDEPGDGQRLVVPVGGEQGCDGDRGPLVGRIQAEAALLVQPVPVAGLVLGPAGHAAAPPR